MRLLFSFFLILTTAFAAETKFYEQVGLGEADLPAYSGPLDPTMEHTLSSGALHFSDDIFSRNYLAPVTSPAIFDLEEIWFEQLPSQSACPNSYLSENIDYIRYLYRLLTMSYLYESLKDYQETLYGFGKSSQTCSVSYDILFKKCNAKNTEMKKFISRARSVITKDIAARSLERYDSKQSNNWLARVRNTREELTPAQGRLRGICETTKAGCDNIQANDIISGLSAACAEDKELFQQVCSESDQLHGLSKIPELVPVLASSNVLKVINAGGHGEACLGRYARLLAIRERWHPPLKWIMPAVKSKLTFGDARYPQGVLFLPGALREFDDRGLSDFLFVEPTPVATATPVPMVAILPKPTPIPTPIVLPRPEFKPPVVVVTPKPTPTPIPLSAFEYAYKIHKNGNEPIDVDMIRFSSEGRFSARVVEKLADALKQYQTRKALQDMRVADELGTKREPVRLMFLKFLIDQDQHQGLWNIVNVIGDEFYVVNDLDGKREAVWVRLRNDRSTAFAWQITILAKK
tara:strand:+ start:7126 stop:8685 length:1560 start_codon:yes stop_codon:yes gene_type:complete